MMGTVPGRNSRISPFGGPHFFEQLWISGHLATRIPRTVAWSKKVFGDVPGESPVRLDRAACRAHRLEPPGGQRRPNQVMTRALDSGVLVPDV